MTIEKLEKRIEDLKTENAADCEHLDRLEKEYENAVNSFNSTKIDKLHAEITGIKATVENRLQQIKLLESKDNPVRIKSKEEQLKKDEQQWSAVKGKADALHQKLLKAQAEYIELANEIYAANEEINAIKREQRRADVPVGPYLNPMKYGVTIGTDRDNKNQYFQGGIYK